MKTDYQEFTEKEEACISRNISEKVKEGMDQKQAIAASISICAPEKARSKNAAKDESAPKPDIPGGQYTAEQNPDGTWNVKNVAIFAEHTVKFGDDEIKVGKGWLAKAKAKEDSRVAKDDYLPPLHIHHHGMRDTSRAGFFRSKSVAQGKYQGKSLWMTFADLVRVPNEVYQKIRAGELPYRSVEIHSLDEPEINSLALLDDEVPFFRMSLLTIGKEVPSEGLEVGPVTAMNAQAAPLLAYRALGTGSNVLMDLGVEPLRRQEMPEDVKKETEEEKEKKGEKMAMDRGEAAKAINGAIAELQKVAAVLAEAEGEEKPAEEEAPAPVEMSAAAGEKGSADADGKNAAPDLEKIPAEYRAPMAHMMGRVDALEREREVERAVFTATQDLVTYGLDQKKTGNKLFSIARKAGIPAMLSYAQAIKDHGHKDPAPGVEGALPTESELPKDMQVFATKGTDVLEKALKYSREFDDNRSHGMKLAFGRKRYVADCLQREGITVEISENEEGK